MSFSINWTIKALDQLEALDEYLFENAPEHVDRILKEIQLVPNILITYPEAGSIEPMLAKVGTFRYLVYSHYKLIYRVHLTRVYIVSIFDTRQNPDKIFDGL
jgi:plasmid stabilization system protein ParE